MIINEKINLLASIARTSLIMAHHKKSIGDCYKRQLFEARRAATKAIELKKAYDSMDRTKTDMVQFEELLRHG